MGIQKEKPLILDKNIPGDKSITHRAVILGALAKGKTTIRGFLKSADCLATLSAFQQMGVSAAWLDSDTLQITGVGLNGLKEPEEIIDCGNSGTTLRLMAGLLAGQPFPTMLVGDASLQQRPMRRITRPLSEMGANINARDGLYPPINIRPSSELHGIEYSLPVASAQVKSCILLAGLYAQGNTTVIEPAPSRDHSERILRDFGADLKTEGSHITLTPGRSLKGREVIIPVDFSSAAFWIVAAIFRPAGEVTLIKNVGINPTRTGLLDVLLDMGAQVALENKRLATGEPIADLKITAGGLRGPSKIIQGELIPRIIDEIPILSIAAALAEGETQIRQAEELRVKESDRIKTVVWGLESLGVEVEEYEDGMLIVGKGKLGSPQHSCESYGDHRIAMSLAIAGLIAYKKPNIVDLSCITSSYPLADFQDCLELFLSS
jgi:3-phosphoshikimate 1-carboxyvinyltransferase